MLHLFTKINLLETLIFSKSFIYTINFQLINQNKIRIIFKLYLIICA